MSTIFIFVTEKKREKSLFLIQIWWKLINECIYNDGVPWYLMLHPFVKI